jgi:hypothetical protein
VSSTYPVSGHLVEMVADFLALHLANDDIERCHLIAQEHEGVSFHHQRQNPNRLGGTVT